jgi:hypothetical protein
LYAAFWWRIHYAIDPINATIFLEKTVAFLKLNQLC